MLYLCAYDSVIETQLPKTETQTKGHQVYFKDLNDLPDHVIL